jgi:hypothetical protein
VRGGAAAEAAEAAAAEEAVAAAADERYAVLKPQQPAYAGVEGATSLANEPLKAVWKAVVPRRRLQTLENKCARCLSATLRAEHIRGPPEVVPPGERNAGSRRGAKRRNARAAERAAASAGEEAIASRRAGQRQWPGAS